MHPTWSKQRKTERITLNWQCSPLRGSGKREKLDKREKWKAGSNENILPQSCAEFNAKLRREKIVSLHECGRVRVHAMTYVLLSWTSCSSWWKMILSLCYQCPQWWKTVPLSCLFVLFVVEMAVLCALLTLGLVPRLRDVSAVKDCPKWGKVVSKMR